MSIAEELKYGTDKVTTGAGSDLRTATNIARDMVIEQGMGEGLRDQVFHEASGGGGMMFDRLTHERPYGEETAKKIDENVKKLLEEASTRARKVLLANRKQLDELAKALLKDETLEEEQVNEVLKDTELPEGAELY